MSLRTRSRTAGCSCPGWFLVRVDTLIVTEFDFGARNFMESWSALALLNGLREGTSSHPRWCRVNRCNVIMLGENSETPDRLRSRIVPSNHRFPTWTADEPPMPFLTPEFCLATCHNTTCRPALPFRSGTW